LLVASPSSPVLAIMGGTSWFIANGLITSVGSLLIVAPMFGVAIPWARLPELLALMILVTVSMYMAGTFIGFYPDAIRRISDFLPLTHGLGAIREVFGDGRAGYILGHAALEAAVGAGWLVLALTTFTRMADAGRRNGSIVFAGG